MSEKAKRLRPSQRGFINTQPVGEKRDPGTEWVTRLHEVSHANGGTSMCEITERAEKVCKSCGHHECSCVNRPHGSPTEPVSCLSHATVASGDYEYTFDFGSKPSMPKATWDDARVGAVVVVASRDITGCSDGGEHRIDEVCDKTAFAGGFGFRVEMFKEGGLLLKSAAPKIVTHESKHDIDAIERAHGMATPTKGDLVHGTKLKGMTTGTVRTIESVDPVSAWLHFTDGANATVQSAMTNYTLVESAAAKKQDGPPYEAPED